MKNLATLALWDGNIQSVGPTPEQRYFNKWLYSISDVMAAGFVELRISGSHLQCPPSNVI